MKFITEWSTTLADLRTAPSMERSPPQSAISCTASIVQGSGIGPASYVVTAADLQTLNPGNLVVKYADDTYLVIPACNVQSRAAELDNQQSAMSNEV